MWKQHLRSVKRELSNEGRYMFQFAYRPGGTASDVVGTGINGCNVYRPEEMLGMLEEAGYGAWELSAPMSLERFDSEGVWYFCSAC